MTDLHRPNPELPTSQLEISVVDDAGCKALVKPANPDSTDAWIVTEVLCNAEDYR